MKNLAHPCQAHDEDAMTIWCPLFLASAGNPAYASRYERGRSPDVSGAAFPGQSPLSDAAFIAALRRMGYPKEEMCAHGFRAMASTLLK